MKFVKYLLLTASVITIISACQKELDFVTDGFAHGTLKEDANGDCLPSTVNGIYKADSVLDNTNFIDVQVNLTSTGAYDIKSDTINGYSFKGAGTLGITGLNTVRLYATGKPLVSGTDIFTINFDSTSCDIAVTVIGAGTSVAVFTLGGAPGNCSGAVLNPAGVYTAGTPLDVNNTVTIDVDVVSTGTYSMTAASVNGMVFTSAGVFTLPGVQSVTLNGAGTPTAEGTFNVTAANTNLSSTCTFSITVLPAGGTGPAVYTLDVTGTSCSGATSSGTYTAGTALTAANVVIINTTVTNVGTGAYTITSNTVNGMTFSGTGTFTTVGGPQPVSLVGSGTPTTSGVFNFTATAGASTCTFSITVNAVPPPPANEDYVPETAFSNWSDKLVGGAPGDTSYVRVSPNTIVKNGTTYHIYEVLETGTPVDSAYHRKVGGVYYQLFNQTYGFDDPFNTDAVLLDSTQNVNYTWTINLGNNTVNGGVIPATGKIVGLITAKGASATIAGNSYTNIIKVTYTYSYNIGGGDTPYAVEEIWYARGKGVVNYFVNDVPVTSTDNYETTRLQVF